MIVFVVSADLDSDLCAATFEWVRGEGIGHLVVEQLEAHIDLAL